MLLEHKKAVIYGAAGAIGGAVARSFAHEGADLVLAGRIRARVGSVAEEISAAGGVAEAAEIDALDEDAIEKHMDDVVARAQRIDVLFNALGMDDVQGTLLVDMSAEDFAQPVINLRAALPNGTFIAFTGTPISQAERNTRAVFGDYIDIYDLSRAVADGATVRVFYENRHVPVRMPEDIEPDDLDERAAEAISQLPAEQQRSVQRAFRMIEGVVGAPERLWQVAADIVAHWERRREQMAKHTGVPGKGLIVCLSRRVCALLYDEIIALRPEWAHEADDKGMLKVVYDARPSEPEPISHHARNESRNKAIQQRLREPDDDLELVIVTCGSPASIARPCTRCTWTSQCAGRHLCRRSLA